MQHRAARRGIRAAWLCATIAALVFSNGALAQRNRPPVFLSTPIASAASGAAYSYEVKVTDADAQDKVKISAPTLPKWLKLVDHGDRSATLSGVPAASDAGANTVVLEADDDEDKVQQQFTITVANRAPTAAADSYSTIEGVQLTVAAASGVLANDTDPDGDALTAVGVGARSTARSRSRRTARSPILRTPGYQRHGYVQVPRERRCERRATKSPSRSRSPARTGRRRRRGQLLRRTRTRRSACPRAACSRTTPIPTATRSLPRSPATRRAAASSLNADGSFTYTPAANFNGTATFSYRASDGQLSSAPATVTINVIPP